MIAHPATYAHGVPYGTFAELREHRPVAWADEPLLVRHSAAGRMAGRGSGYWAVTRHAAVTEASRCTDVFSSAEHGAFLVDPRTRTDLDRTRELLVNMDAPRHTRIRRVVSSVFTPRAVRRLADGVRGHARDLVAAVRNGELDAVTGLATELPLLVLADLLGMPAGDRRLLFDWSNHLVGFDDPEYGGGDVDAYRKVFADAFAYALKLAADRREHPGEDLSSRLAIAEVDGRRFTDREFCHLWLLMVVAGNETTRHLISGSLLALAEHDDQRRHLCADPDRLDLRRDSNTHLAFGIGPHFCLGAGLARLELCVLLEELRPRLTDLRLTDRPVRLESNFVNGLKSLPVRFGGPT